MNEGSVKTFIELFEKWNRSINLSAAASREDLLEHITDSLHVVPLLAGAQRVLDVGSGGGFPVVLAALALPEVQFIALEPIHKKHAFLRTVAREIPVPNLEPRAERAEDHRDHDYDAAMSRATFDLAEWLALGAQFVRPGGKVLGFEAVRRSDLPPGTERHPYALADKSRAIIVFPVDR
ncbi:MAG TPA: 16S rRNA (guanine(527)-N(7))-methyltransferase RsmG [Kofleriaceae bacterium]|jgi:16S rRNA (guanine527-N7)-methyltransferase